MKFRAAISLLSVPVVLAFGVTINTPNTFAQGDYSMVNARDTVHINSCGSCHLPYSPGLLPLQSWTLIMAGLDDHFGAVVDLSEEDSAHILTYIEKYALKAGQNSIMGRLAENLPDTPFLRITELPAFVVMHNNAAQQLGFEDNEQVSLSTCESCHRAAASHIFDKALLQIGHGDGRLSDYK